MTMVDTAASIGTNADYALFDFLTCPGTNNRHPFKGMDVIVIIKKSSRVKYSYCCKLLNIKEIYSQNKKTVADQRICALLMLWRRVKFDSGERCLRKERSESKGLACFYLCRYDSFRRRGHSHL